MARTGRPLAMPVEERKEAIYSAAETLFGEQGYEKVTMNDIASAAGMSKKTLYQLFTDKETLLRGLVESSYVWPEDTLDTEAADPVAALVLRLRVIANHVLSDRHIKLSRLAIGESIGRKDIATTFVETGVGKSRESLVEAITNVPPARHRVDLPPTTLAGMLYGATCGYQLMNALLTGTKPDLARVYATIDEVVEKMFG